MLKIPMILFFVLNFLSSGVLAEEPAYCNPKTFYSKEVTEKVNGIKRLHSFRLGKVLLSGLAVGLSKTEAVEKFATDNSSVNGSEKFCTWYINKMNRTARESFTWKPVENPKKDLKKSLVEFTKLLDSSVNQDAINMVQCAENYGYIALGCDGQMHRGPTLFAMLLSFTGCTPEHSVEIANHLWGENGVPVKNRIAIAQRGFEMGNDNPEAKEKLTNLFSN